ncbi:hypothetical protein AK812_SmicGene46803 [Symbiodinium microadriaticum]|uniref:Uncharacterized protein n=1 Tax=Symbiodinium microadriaticum TaxID=2951 RepID=A0A1Q9BT04_SYMMI|nr:hypothetical protein AK812_SmicGene46803 [Symbiodinium microadriaticum]
MVVIFLCLCLHTIMLMITSLRTDQVTPVYTVDNVGLHFRARGALAQLLGTVRGLPGDVKRKSLLCPLMPQVQLCVLDRAGKGSKELEKNEDKTLTFREEDGLTKLVPLIPEPHADRKQAVSEGFKVATLSLMGVYTGITDF